MNRPRLRAAATAFVAFSAAIVLSSCSGTATGSDSGSSRSDTVIIGTGATPQSLDPILASDVQTDFTDAAMYDKLVSYDENGELSPQISTEWSYSADATSVTLTLRDDVVFHSGTKLTAADVVYTLDRDKRLGIGVSSFLSSYESANAVDDSHVEITLNTPNTTFVGALAKVYVIDSTLVTENAGSDDGQAWLASNDAGSGVYALTDYTANQTAEFERFDDSWRFDDARPEAIVYRYITESATLRDELSSGGVDVVTGLTATDLATFDGKSGFTVNTLPSYLQLYAMMNTQSGALADERVREAISLAYDYQGHVDTILSGNGEVASGVVAPNLACRVDTGTSEQDVDTAKDLLAEAGVSNLTLTLAYQSTIPEHQKAATLLQSNLADIGVTLNLQTVTFPEYSSMVTSADTTPDMALLWDFPYYPEIGPMLYRVYDSQFIDQTNYGRYANPEVDQLLEAGIASTDTAAACSDYEQAQELIAADHVGLNISNPTTSQVLREGLGGITFDPTSQLFNVTTLTLTE
ncbi:ABC transporter substrate-binding protein [Microbacteriaceae bacterium VKM Ac-2854]|nr:ABC transporter substrate-binding protein [Microbacteriaceae bacterium VKM Ac-2854]